MKVFDKDGKKNDRGVWAHILGSSVLLLLSLRPERKRPTFLSHHGFYSRWGQLAHLTKLRFFIRKRDRQTSDIDKQKEHHQETVKMK